MSDTPHLLTEEKDGIMICTLNRPDKLNALTPQFYRLFLESLVRFRDTAELKVMLIRATGRYFCAGVDVRAYSPDPNVLNAGSSIREMMRTRMDGMHSLFDEMEHIEKPIVAAHHAACWGGGLELSLSCDFRLAAKSAHYAFPEGKLGNIPASNGVSRLTRICGTHWARWLIMAGKIANAEKAERMGLVHEVFPDETFEEEVMAFCRHLVAQNAEAMGTAKLAIEMAGDVGLAQARSVERMANSTLMLAPEYRAIFAGQVQNIGGKGKSA